MITITISGIAGRMGKMIASCACEDPETTIVSGIEAAGHPCIGKQLSEAVHNELSHETVIEDLKSITEIGDVIIDFSHHEVTVPLMEKAVQLGKPIVIGTTGFTQTEEDRIRELSNQIACVKSPNMSIGINVLFNLARQAASAMGQSCDIEIVEAHHRFKKDAPSGTAKKLLEIVAEASGKDAERDTVYGREGLIGERPSSEIGVFAVRGGDIVGDHTVFFAGLGERIELTHRAHTRATLARGALQAAKFIVGKEKGLFDMQDVLGLKK